jgi:hypothetical protein
MNCLIDVHILNSISIQLELDGVISVVFDKDLGRKKPRSVKSVFPPILRCFSDSAKNTVFQSHREKKLINLLWNAMQYNQEKGKSFLLSGIM